jgi:hypothetical protein
VVSPGVLAHGAEMAIKVGNCLNCRMDALAWLVMASLVFLLIIDKLGGYLEVLKFLVVRCRIVKRLLLIRAQNKAVNLLGLM